MTAGAHLSLVKADRKRPKRFSAAERSSAVAGVRARLEVDGVSVAEAVREVSGAVGCAPSTLRRWVSVAGPESAVGDPPAELGKVAKGEWRRMVRQMGVRLRPEDRAALAGYCFSYAQFLEASALVERHGVVVPGGDRGPAMVKNPAAQVARDAQVKMREWLKALKVIGPAADDGQPPPPGESAERLLS